MKKKNTRFNFFVKILINSKSKVGQNPPGKKITDMKKCKKNEKNSKQTKLASKSKKCIKKKKHQKNDQKQAGFGPGFGRVSVVLGWSGLVWAGLGPDRPVWAGSGHCRLFWFCFVVSVIVQTFQVIIQDPNKPNQTDPMVHQPGATANGTLA